ncbi:unnamed protein product, partial [Adineta steineri]
DEVRKSMEVQKDVDDVDKDLLSHELEQANQKLNWFNEKFKEYSDLQSNMDLLILQNKQLENDSKIEQDKNKSNLELIQQYQEKISQLQSNETIDHNNTDELNRLLIEERQRCDAL